MTKDDDDRIYAAGVEHGQASRQEGVIETIAKTIVSAPFSTVEDTLFDSRERDIYKKGEEFGKTHPSSEENSSSSSSSSDSCCYIVGACLDELHLPRTSQEMLAMKVLAKDHILKSFSGKRDYVRYGKLGPKIVEAIRARSDSQPVWRRIYEGLREITPKVQRGDLKAGYDQYKSMVLGLEEQFLKVA